MPTNAYANSAAARRPARWLEWLVVIAVVVILLGQLVVRPLVEQLLTGVGGLVATMAAGAAMVVEQNHANACQTIETDPQVRILFGEGVICPSIERVKWADATPGDRLECRFPIETVSGILGEAYVISSVGEHGAHVESIVVSAPQGAVLLLPVR